MVDLQLSSGLPLKFDDLSEKFQYGEGVVFTAINHVPLKSMLPGLLNKSLRYPENVYLEHRNISHDDHREILEKSDLNFDLIMLPAGLMGVEFIRSHVFYGECGSGGKLSEIVEVVKGELTVLLQRNEPQVGEYVFDTTVSEGLVVKLNQGEKFSIPKGFFYTFINARDYPVVFSRFYIDGCICDYSKFNREQGLAYFAIRKNAKREIVLNPRYRNIPQIRTAKVAEVSWAEQPGIGMDQPLYSQIVSQPERLSSYL